MGGLRGRVHVVLDPHKRLTMGDALQHPYFSGRQLVVSDAMKPAGRGVATLLHRELEDPLIDYLQADPYWEQLYEILKGKKKGKVQNVGAKEEHLKKEDCGYVSKDVPQCTKWAKMDANKLLRARRVVQFSRCTMKKNEAWLVAHFQGEVGGTAIRVFRSKRSRFLE